MIFWGDTPSCYLELLDNLQKRICATVRSSLSASLETLAHRRNVASLSLFCRYYFGRWSSELFQLVSLPYSWGRCTRYSDRLHDFSVTIPRCYKDVYADSFFPRTARIWNSLAVEWSEWLLQTSFNCRFFLNTFHVGFKLYVLIFLAIPCFVVAVQPSLQWIPIKKKRILTT